MEPPGAVRRGRSGRLGLICPGPRTARRSERRPAGRHLGQVPLPPGGPVSRASGSPHARAILARALDLRPQARLPAPASSAGRRPDACGNLAQCRHGGGAARLARAGRRTRRLAEPPRPAAGAAGLAVRPDGAQRDRRDDGARARQGDAGRRGAQRAGGRTRRSCALPAAGEAGAGRSRGRAAGRVLRDRGRADRILRPARPAARRTRGATTAPSARATARSRSVRWRWRSACGRSRGRRCARSWRSASRSWPSPAGTARAARSPPHPRGAEAGGGRARGVRRAEPDLARDRRRARGAGRRQRGRGWRCGGASTPALATELVDADRLVVGDGGGLLRRDPAAPLGRARAAGLRQLLGAQGVPDTAPDAPGRPPRAGLGFPGDPDPVPLDRRRLVRDGDHLHPGLHVPAAAAADGAGRRHRAASSPRRRSCSGA